MSLPISCSCSAHNIQEWNPKNDILKFAIALWWCFLLSHTLSYWLVPVRIVKKKRNIVKIAMLRMYLFGLMQQSRKIFFFQVLSLALVLWHPLLLLGHARPAWCSLSHSFLSIYPHDYANIMGHIKSNYKKPISLCFFLFLFNSASCVAIYKNTHTYILWYSFQGGEGFGPAHIKKIHIRHF